MLRYDEPVHSLLHGSRQLLVERAAIQRCMSQGAAPALQGSPAQQGIHCWLCWPAAPLAQTQAACTFVPPKLLPSAGSPAGPSESPPLLRAPARSSHLVQVLPHPEAAACGSRRPGGSGPLRGPFRQQTGPPAAASCTHAHTALTLHYLGALIPQLGT